MVEATFVGPDNAEQLVDVPEGWSLMEVARRDGIDGIIGECGGGAICGTCHVHVDATWCDRIPTPEPMEESMLGLVPERGATSRLSCQIVMGTELDGIRVRIPSEQLDY